MRKEQWRAHVDECARRGESPSVYCNRVGLNAQTFSYWRSILKRESSEQRYVEVLPSSPSKVLELSDRSGEVVVRLPLDASLEVLTRIVEVLRCSR